VWIYRFQKYRTVLARIVYHVVTTVGDLEEEEACSQDARYPEENIW